MKYTNTPNAGELLAGFLTEAIQEQAEHLTPEPSRVRRARAYETGAVSISENITLQK